jgi:hypothetical protein
LIFLKLWNISAIRNNAIYDHSFHRTSYLNLDMEILLHYKTKEEKEFHGGESRDAYGHLALKKFPARILFLPSHTWKCVITCFLWSPKGNNIENSAVFDWSMNGNKKFKHWQIMNRNIWKNTRDSYRHQEVRAHKSITMGKVRGL